MHIRTATTDDASAIAAIYAPIVAHTPISFELEPPSVAEMQTRIHNTLQTLPWLVAVDTQGQLLGYVYASKFRERVAYQWTVEVTAYVHENARGQGVAKQLYTALFEQLVALGYHQAMATITLPNPASVALHEGLGFAPAGLFRNVGHKLGAWRHVGYWQKALRTNTDADANCGQLPAAPKNFVDARRHE
jgi:L-amino acid N-acyltransferase YncA